LGYTLHTDGHANGYVNACPHSDVGMAHRGADQYAGGDGNQYCCCHQYALAYVHALADAHTVADEYAHSDLHAVGDADIAPGNEYAATDPHRCGSDADDATLADQYTLADAYTVAVADPEAVGYEYTGAHQDAVAHVHTLADADAVADAYAVADADAVPDLHAVGYADTAPGDEYTVADKHRRGADGDDAILADQHAGTDVYTLADRDAVADTDALADADARGYLAHALEHPSLRRRKAGGRRRGRGKREERLTACVRRKEAAWPEHLFYLTNTCFWCILEARERALRPFLLRCSRRLRLSPPEQLPSVNGALEGRRQRGRPPFLFGTHPWQCVRAPPAGKQGPGCARICNQAGLV
jgi:hypothetical protein